MPIKLNIIDRDNKIVDDEFLELKSDNWDDYGFKTCFHVDYIKDGECIYLGEIRMGYKDMEHSSYSNTANHTSVELSKIVKSEGKLTPDFFSLGVSEEYYIDIKEKGFGENIFITLNDIGYNLELFESHKNELVLQNSLLRTLTEKTVKNKINRLSHGGAELTEYDFTYTSKYNNKYTFQVEPNSLPPSNIHVLIGRNGCGKTSLIKEMIETLILPKESDGKYTTNNNYDDFSWLVEEGPIDLFANILCVSFSPFDELSKESNNPDIKYSYIGLDKDNGNLFETIKSDFIKYAGNCMASLDKKRRWLKVLSLLHSDPLFREIELEQFIDNTRDGDKIIASDDIEEFTDVFSRLSSGHKVVLLIITACVDKLEEKTILFLDEPENHLHPPLLSALIRALSYLLINRNSVSIISTHSPIILQEVPKSCVWKIRRVGSQVNNSRLDIETFGATFSSLNYEIFGLEVNESGYMSMIREVAKKSSNIEEVIEKFNNQLGESALAMIDHMLLDNQE